MLLSVATSATAQVGNQDAILDEITAGYKANRSRILHGFATYRVVTKCVATDTASECDQKIIFDGENTRTEKTIGERLVQVETITASRYADFFGDNPEQGDAQSVIIKQSKELPAFDIHPTMLGLCYESEHLATLISVLRNDPKCRMDVQRQVDCYVLTYVYPSQNVKERFWIALNQGYCVARHRKETLSIPDQAYTERKSTYRKTPSGVYVAEHTKLSRWSTRDRKTYVDPQTVDVTLQEIDLKTQPSPDEFALEGMGLKKHLDVQDRIHGKDLVWGVSVHREADIFK